MSLFWAGAPPDLVSRVFSKMRHNSDSNCLEWTGAKYKSGCGQYDLRGKQWRPHRLVWTICNGEIPDGMIAMHTCDNPICVNPSHLRLGTHRDNVLDKISKERHRGGKNQPRPSGGQG